MSGRKKGNAFGLIITIFVIIVIISQMTGHLRNKISFGGSGLKIPPAVGYVNDFAGIISPENERTLDRYLKELEQKTEAEIAVVTLSSLNGNAIENVALDIGRKWGVGKKGKNNGIVILVASGDKKMRIEVGYGLEGIITDGKAGRIRDEYMLPYFREGNMEKGIINGTLAAAAVIADAYRISMPQEFNASVYKVTSAHSNYHNQKSYSQRELATPELIIFIILFIIFGFIPRRSSFAGGYVHYGSGFGGNSSGFGGFGSGSFGGGGSSGGW